VWNEIFVWAWRLAVALLLWLVWYILRDARVDVRQLLKEIADPERRINRHIAYREKRREYRNAGLI
jgi:hypothetical protein